jgi:hypothetical protein
MVLIRHYTIVCVYSHVGIRHKQGLASLCGATEQRKRQQLLQHQQQLQGRMQRWTAPVIAVL